MVTDYPRRPLGRYPVPDRAYRRRALLHAVAVGIFAAALGLSMIGLLVSPW